MDRLSSGPVGRLLLLLAALTTFALGQNISLYYVVGNSLTLTPPTKSSPIKSVVWTHSKNLVAEWLGEGTDYYGPFQGRTILYPSSGILNITQTTLNDQGTFTVEINNLVLDEEYTAIAIKKVTKPTLELRTLSCNKDSNSCTYSCLGETAGMGPVTYSLRIDQRQWEPEQESPEFELFQGKVRDGKMIECRMKNPLSQEISDPVENRLYHEPGGHGGLIGGLFILFVCVCAVSLGIWKQQYILEKISQCKQKNPNANEAGEAGEAGEAREPMNA